MRRAAPFILAFVAYGAAAIILPHGLRSLAAMILSGAGGAAVLYGCAFRVGWTS